MSLRIQTEIIGLVIVPGSLHAMTVNVRNLDGTTFNLTGYSVKAKVEIGSVDLTVTGTAGTPANGNAVVTFTAAQTILWPASTWGMITLYADPASGSENDHISTVHFRTSAEVIP